jgi:hypothetical protein
MTGKPPAVRNAIAGDMLELKRLFYALMAESGIDDFSIAKAERALERGIKREGAILTVAPDRSGRLIGFILFTLQPSWFSDTAQIVQTALFIERGHRRSLGAMELRKVSRLARQWAKAPKPSIVRPAPKPQPSAQNGTGTAPQPVMAGDADKPDKTAVDGVDALLQTLAERNRPETVATTAE